MAQIPPEKANKIAPLNVLMLRPGLFHRKYKNVYYNCHLDGALI